jgi:hypothetical protein
MVNKSKRKGSRREYQMRDWFKELGLRCKRVILSGALGGKFSGDLDLFLPRQRKPIKVEVKGRKTEPAKTLLGWKKDCDILIVKVDNKPPYFLLDEDMMKVILSRVK